MVYKTRKTAVVCVLALLFIIQLVFLNNKKNTDPVTQDKLIEKESIPETSTAAEADVEYDEVIIPAELSVVYRNSEPVKDIAAEMSDSIQDSPYDNKIVSYTLEQLIIYENPDSKSAITGYMYSGSEGTILEKGEEWTKIKSGEVTGYIRNLDVLFGNEAEVIASIIGNKKARITESAKVFADADSKSEVISEVASGAEIDAYEKTGEYTLVSCDAGFGYVKTDVLDISYGLAVAKTKAEIDAIEAAKREEAAREAARLAAAQAAAAQEAAKQNAIASSTTTRAAYNVSAEELHLLAAIVYWESGWEPLNGQLAVANVVLNRVFSPRFAQNTITSVVYAPGQFSGVTENGAPSARFQGILNMTNEQLNVRGCYDVALRALAGENNIGDMLFFINVKKANFPKYTAYTIINNHCFYTY